MRATFVVVVLSRPSVSLFRKVPVYQVCHVSLSCSSVLLFGIAPEMPVLGCGLSGPSVGLFRSGSNCGVKSGSRCGAVLASLF